MAEVERSTTIEGDGTCRVDIVVRELSQASHSRVRGMFDNHCVMINSKACGSGATPVRAGDVVSIKFDPERKYQEKRKRWDDRTFTIAFEDEDLIVVDKAAGTLTVPTDKNESNTLVERVSICISHSKRAREAWVVHRLDRDVSGLLVFGKHKKVADRLIEQFRHRKPERVYTAIVAGVIAKDTGMFQSHIGSGKNSDQPAEPESPEVAITRYQVVKRLQGATLIDLTLESGLRNQIRFHLAREGHPVLGDTSNKSARGTHPRWIRKRIALHAKTLGFIHPVSEEPMAFESPLPSAIAKFVAGKRK